MDKVPHKVVLAVSTEHEYEVDASTPEEAIEIAESYFADGEEGAIISTNIDVEDAYPNERETN